MMLFSILLCGPGARWAGAQTPPAAPQPQPTQPAPAPAPPAKSAPAEERFETSDGHFSIKLIYWYNPATPVVKTGAAAAVDTVSLASFPGKNKPTPGAELSFPAGKNNTIRISVFRMQNAGNTTAPNIPSYQQNVIWSTAFNSGDYLATSYSIQNAKISLDYLSWPFPLNNARFRVKTLWEVQYTNVKSSVSAPFAPTTDSSGNSISTSGSGSRWFIWPSLGMGVEYMISKNFRFEAKGSGFAIPHRPTLWDTEAIFAYRSGAIEIDFGAKAFHFKTSPKRNEYFQATLPGAYVGIRWYPK